jgi:hypothetical protein
MMGYGMGIEYGIVSDVGRKFSFSSPGKGPEKLKREGNWREIEGKREGKVIGRFI